MPAFKHFPYRLPLLATLLAGLPATVFAETSPNAEPPTFIQSNEASAKEGEYAEARGDVVVTRENLKVESDWAQYTIPDDRLRAGDKVTMHKDGDILTGTKLDMLVDPRKGDLLDPTYQMAKGAARGDAVKLIFDGPDRYIVRQARMTTCAPGSNDWYLHSSTLDLDYNTNVGQAWNGWLEFKGTPVLYYPWMDFSLDGSRKSGFLAPSFGMNSSNGLQIQTPYYLNLAPNYDATISPRYMSRRGLMLGGEFRYLGQDYAGILRAEGIQDQVEANSRGSILFQHKQKFDNNLSLDLNLQKVSDNTYFSDFGDRLAVSSQSNLPREGTLSYSNEDWSGFIRMQRYQTLSTVTNPVEKPYARMPQLYFTSQPKIAPWLDTNISGELVDFKHPDKISGLRTWAYPSVALPLNETWGFIKPKIGVHATYYNLDQTSASTDQTYTRTLPITSLDTGLFFDRETQLGGKTYSQTLEPRAYYLYIPYRKQSQLPIFDSGETDLSLTQLFSENQYSGQDRISDANQVTLAVTSRLFEAESGIERLNLTVGQRFYFADQRVTLSTSENATSEQRSDWLLTLGARFWKDLSANYGLQYNQADSSLRRSDATLTWRPGDFKTLNLGYSVNRITDTRSTNISGQWPLGNGWYALGRYNYSIQDKRALEALAGVEYNAGCWAVRLAAQRYVTSTTDYSTSFFAMLQLGGIAGIGNNPLDAIRRSIPGYTNTYATPRF